MTDVSQELLHEVLRRLHQRNDKTDLAVKDLRSECSSLRRIMTSHQGDLDTLYELIHRIEDRLDKIEKRLELRDFQEMAQSPFDAST